MKKEKMKASLYLLIDLWMEHTLSGQRCCLSAMKQELHWMDKIMECYLINIWNKLLIDVYHICPFQTALLSVSNEAKASLNGQNRWMLSDKYMEEVSCWYLSDNVIRYSSCFGNGESVKQKKHEKRNSNYHKNPDWQQVWDVVT